MGGEVGRTIIINAPEWNDSSYRGATLVDGKQRLEAIRKFMRNELAVFDGHTLNQIEGVARFFVSRIKWRVVSLRTRLDVLKFYLSINTGGTPHSLAEISKVCDLVAKEDGRNT